MWIAQNERTNERIIKQKKAKNFHWRQPMNKMYIDSAHTQNRIALLAINDSIPVYLKQVCLPAFCCCAFLINHRSLLIEFFRSHSTRSTIRDINLCVRDIDANAAVDCEWKWGYEMRASDARHKNTYIRKWSQKSFGFFQRTFCLFSFSFYFILCVSIDLWVADRFCRWWNSKLFSKRFNDNFVSFDKTHFENRLFVCFAVQCALRLLLLLLSAVFRLVAQTVWTQLTLQWL